MNSKLIKLGVVAGVLILTGCSNQNPETADPGPGPTAAATPTSATSSPRATSAPPSATASESPPETEEESDSEYCPKVMAHSRPALTALKKLVKNPSGKGLDVGEFEGPRDTLYQDEQKAPDHLRTYVHTMVEVLDDTIDNLKAGNKKLVNIESFKEARVNLIVNCEMIE